MSDARLPFRRTLRGLAPADPRAEDWLRRIKFGSEVLIDPPKQPRNLAMHKLYWALVTLVHDNLDDERAARYPTRETLHQALKISAGLRTEIELPDGRVGFMAGSIAFHRMDQAAFSAFFDRICDIVAKQWLPGVDCEILRAEVEQMLGMTMEAA